ncbi:lamin tail domain-containing protein [Halobacterium jilantaiense]|uniref:Competence protein ComEC n=1 Tax=Halobacterium jilantaiense TaxID=355548 RepID=A0A1I0MUN7_9EURY|nr:lamin tail domain-containing protein [Halobacterium jilantaiense]SEV92509.1 competence protein ComEC [Halobacterium jilantaiense]
MDRRRVIVVLGVVALVALAGCTGAVSDGAVAPSEQTDAPPDSQSASGSQPTVDSPNGTLSVHFLDVGQGSSVFVEGPTGETMLMDSGDWRDDGEDVLAYLDARGVERLDYLVTSHADADHIGGHAAVIEHFETESEGVGAVYDPGITASSQTYDNYLDAVEAHDVPLYETRAGDPIPMAGVDIEVLAPPRRHLAGGDRNENSVVLRLGFGNTTLLLPGDGEDESEAFLVDEYGDGLNATVLSAGHHGSASSSGATFLDAATPRVAVVSSAYDSQYGHPHEAVLSRLAERGVRTYWTATHGAVRVTSNGSAVTVATQRDAPTGPLALRDGAPSDAEPADDLAVRAVIPVAGPVADVPPTTTEQMDGSLSVVDVHEDAPGDDNENPNGEYVVFENDGAEPLNLGGWTVTDKAGHEYVFPTGLELGPGERVTLYTGTGTDTRTAVYWGLDRAVWNNAGDIVTVQDDDGSTVTREAY